MRVCVCVCVCPAKHGRGKTDVTRREVSHALSRFSGVETSGYALMLEIRYAATFSYDFIETVSNFSFSASLSF